MIVAEQPGKRPARSGQSQPINEKSPSKLSLTGGSGQLADINP
jgi:hypothetical protein